jgi:hypothetical protein
MATIKPTISYVCDLLARFGIDGVSPETLRQAKFNNLSAEVRLSLWRILHGLCMLHITGYDYTCWSRAPSRGSTSDSGSWGVTGLERAWQARESDAAAAAFVRSHLLETGIMSAGAPPSSSSVADAPAFGPAPPSAAAVPCGASLFLRSVAVANAVPESSAAPQSPPFLPLLAPSPEQLFADTGSRCLLLAMGWLLAFSPGASPFDRYLQLLEQDIEVRLM